MSEFTPLPLRIAVTEADTKTVTEPRWNIGCRDPFGRDRAVTVLIESDLVLIVPPPGASAVLSAQQTRSLGAALGQAAVEVGQRG
ncbi:hypothetical protein ACTG9Q_04820 [Actinokineospora sp. 24-640]